MEQKSGILVFGGSFNPMHMGHVHALDCAKSHLEKLHNWNIIGGYFALAPDKYVETKMKRNESFSIKLNHRFQLMNLCIKEAQDAQANTNLDWIQKSPQFNFLNQHHSSGYELGKKIRAALIADYKIHVDIIVLVGADKIKRKWRKPLKQEYAFTVCIGRDGMMKTLKKYWEEDLRNGLISDPSKTILIDDEVQNVSSTMIRKILIEHGNNVEHNMANIVQRGYLGQQQANYLLRLQHLLLAK